MTTQEKFLGMAEEACAAAGLQFVHNPQWANTGEVRFEDPSSFNPVYRFRYNFQSDHGYATFGGDLAAERSGAAVHYGAELQATINRLREHLSDAILDGRIVPPNMNAALEALWREEWS